MGSIIRIPMDANFDVSQRGARHQQLIQSDVVVFVVNPLGSWKRKRSSMCCLSSCMQAK